MTAALPILVAPVLDVTVLGDPAPQGSKRYLGVGSKGKVRMAESSPKLEPWRADIRTAVADEMPGQAPIAGDVQVELAFRLRRPSGHYGTGRNEGMVRPSAPRYPGRKPDLDKLARAVLDAVGSSGVVWVDDAQVVTLVASKRYAEAHHLPGVRIVVRRCEP